VLDTADIVRDAIYQQQRAEVFCWLTCASPEGLRTLGMKIFLFVLAATVLEAAGDAIVRIALNYRSVLGL
jgi:hypothetical protein